MITKTHDKSLLKDALAKAEFALISTYINGDENPDALDEGLPWERNVELEQLGLHSSPEYIILVIFADRNATIFRGFPTRESAQDALKAAQAALVNPIVERPSDHIRVRNGNVFLGSLYVPTQEQLLNTPQRSSPGFDLEEAPNDDNDSEGPTE